MTLTNCLPRVLAGVALGAVTFVPVALSPATADAAPAGPPPCTAGQEVPIPVFDENGAVTGVNCVPCENLPPSTAAAGGCEPPECDPETELCEPPPCDPETEDCEPPECDPEVEECGEPECDPEVEECEPPPCDPETEECDPPGCDPEVEECGEPGSDPDPDPDPESVDPPVVARPTFTG